MSIYRHIPAPPLNQYVDFCWYYVDLSPDHDSEHVLPDGTFELIINLQEIIDLRRKLRQRHGDAVAWALDRYMAEQDLQTITSVSGRSGLATNTSLTYSDDKPVCRQRSFAGFAVFRRYCSRFKHAQR